MHKTFFFRGMLPVLGLLLAAQGVAMAAEQSLEGKRIAILIAEGFQDAEALAPMAYLANRGAEITVLGPEPGEVQAYNSEFTMIIEKAVAEASVDDFDGLIIPGGRAPGHLREHEASVAFTRDFVESGKVTAAICHGPQLLVTAGVLEGRKATCVSGISGELTEAGALYEDVAVIRDENIITSRVPRDLPDFSKEILAALSED